MSSEPFGPIIESLQALSDRIKAIHPEFATPQLYAELQRQFVETNRLQADLLRHLSDRLFRLAEIEARMDVLHARLLQLESPAWLRRSET